MLNLCLGNNYPRDQGNNRGYHNSYDNRRGGDDFSRNYDRPPPNRDYNRRDGGFMSRDRGERDNNRFDYRVSKLNKFHIFVGKSACLKL